MNGRYEDVGCIKEPQKKRKKNEKEAVKADVKVENEKPQTRARKIVTEEFEKKSVQERPQAQAKAKQDYWGH